MAVQASLIKTLYLYIFSGVGLCLIIIGAYTGISYAVKVSQFDKYPLEEWRDVPCTYPGIVPMGKVVSAPEPAVAPTQLASPSAQEIEKLERTCEDNKELQRKVKKTQDLTHTISMLLLGTLVFIPHWKLARKTS